MNIKINKYFFCSFILILFFLYILLSTRHTVEENDNEMRITYRHDICKSNMRRILFALRQYHEEYGKYPPPIIVSNGLCHSWRAAILPYFEIQDYRMNEPWNSSWNNNLAKKVSSVFRCPHERKNDKDILTSYCMIVPNDSSINLAGENDILEKSSVLIVEAYNTGIPLLSPNDIKLEQVLLGPRQPNNNKETILIGGIHKYSDEQGQEGIFFVGDKDGTIRKLSYRNSTEEILQYEK